LGVKRGILTARSTSSMIGGVGLDDEQVRRIQAAAKERIAELIGSLRLNHEEKAFAESLGNELVKSAMHRYVQTVTSTGLSTTDFRPLCVSAALAYALAAVDEFVTTFKPGP
jgi:hypothetical protein